MTNLLHIIEPTLEGEAGHCFSFVNSLCQVDSDYPVTVWCGRNADIILPINVEIRRFFYRKLRRIQAWWLYRALLRRPGRMFISTAGRIDFVLLDLASSDTIALGKVFLYVHWFRTSPVKQRQLEKIAARQPEIIVLAPTESICETFRVAGFNHTRLVPYPITPQIKETTQTTLNRQQDFSHVLFAGAARYDKGFKDVVAFVELLSETGSIIPVRMQTSTQHYAKTDEVTIASLARLKQVAYMHLKLNAETLQHEDYHALFIGAICLQLYSQQDFADRISGVTLDALSMGSPIITLSGTWIARVVTEFNAGLVIDSPTPVKVLNAVTLIMSDYGQYHNRALDAGRELQKRNSAAVLFHELIA